MESEVCFLMDRFGYMKLIDKCYEREQGHAVVGAWRFSAGGCVSFMGDTSSARRSRIGGPQFSIFFL